MYDNETEQFVDLGDLCNNADWYVETEGGMFTPSLYIIPHDMNLENMGPDNETMDAFNAYCREHDSVPSREWVEENLALEYIDTPLRRFNEIDGYYTA